MADHDENITRLEFFTSNKTYKEINKERRGQKQNLTLQTAEGAAGRNRALSTANLLRLSQM